jgi:hypothetical protein
MQEDNMKIGYDRFIPTAEVNYFKIQYGEFDSHRIELETWYDDDVTSTSLYAPSNYVLGTAVM